MKEGIAEKILKLRMALQLSQKDFANLLNVRQSTASSWENGIIIPHMHILEKLAQIGEEHNIVFTIEDLFKFERKERNKSNKIRFKSKK